MKALSGGDGLFHVDKTVGQRDRHDEAKLYLSRFRQHAQNFLILQRYILVPGGRAV